MPALKMYDRILLKHGGGLIGRVTEIVPAGQLPSTVKHNAAWRRHQESYVVTVMAPRTIELRAVGGSKRAHTLSCRRIWPAPESLTPLGAERRMYA